MKKLVALFLTAAMMLCALPAFATEINWADLEAQSAETVAKGEFVTFDEISIKMWMPTVLSAVELTDEDKEGGYIGYYMTEDESAAISVVYADVDGMSLEDYKAALADNGATEVEDVTANGLPAVTYVLEESDTACIAFTTEAGYVLEVAGSPKSDEGFAAILSFVMASIQSAEGE